jgi:hypothetical protein
LRRHESGDDGIMWTIINTNDNDNGGAFAAAKGSAGLLVGRRR